MGDPDLSEKMALSGDEREAAAGQERVFLRTSKSRENSMLPGQLREVERGGVTRRRRMGEYSGEEGKGLGHLDTLRSP